MLDFGYYNIDCMEGMREFPDKYFDLAIVDPPYGDAGVSGGGYWNRFGERFDRYINAPTRQRGKMESFEQVERGRRSSEKNHRVGRRAGKRIFRRTFPRLTESDYMGGNYFELPANRCFLIWRKTNVPEKFSMAMCEYAWTSFNDNAKWFEISAVGQQGRFHPTQKPVELYKWLLTNYAKPGDKILDTHVGSASSLIACEDLGFKYVGFEIDEEYYKLGTERIAAHTAQMTISDLIGDWRFP